MGKILVVPCFICALMAVRKAEEAVEREEVLLDVDDYDDREIVPSEYWEGGRIPDGEDVSCYWQLDCIDSRI